MRSRLEAAGATLLAVSVDGPEEAAALRAKHALGFPVLGDASLRVTNAYGVLEDGKSHPRPATFVLDADRKVVFRHVGANTTDRPALKDVLAAAGA